MSLILLARHTLSILSSKSDLIPVAIIIVKFSKNLESFVDGHEVSADIFTRGFRACALINTSSAI